jgi:hypothetical protein
MTTNRLRTRRRLAAVVASAVALGGLIALAPAATAEQTGAPLTDSGTAVWGISDYLNSGNPGRPGPAVAAYTAPATFNATSKLTTFGGGNPTGTIAADGTAVLAYQGASVNWAAGAGNGWIRFADPIVTVDATGTGTVSAEVSYGVTPDGTIPPPAGAVRGPTRITVETLSPDPENGDAAYPTSLSSLTYAFAASPTTYTWSNLIGRWSEDMIAFLATNDGTTGTGWAFKSTVVNNVVSSVVRYPAALNLSLNRAVAATSVTPSVEGDTIKLAVNGTGFLKTAPGIYVSLRERAAGDSTYAGGSLPTDAPTAWVSNSAADIGPDPATGANAAIDDNGSFSATITLDAAAVANLDPTKTYSIVTRKAHGQGGVAANASQITEIPVDIASLKKTTTLAATAANVAFPGAATASITVNAPAGTPNGTVTIMDGATVVDTNVLLDTGKVDLSVPDQAVGTKQYTVLYSGASGFWRSSGTLDVTVTVTKQATAIVVAGPAAVAYRTAATYTATLPQGAGKVSVTGAGAAVQASIVNGKATFKLPTTLTAGRRTLTFAYAGDASTAAAAPVHKTITVAKGATKIGVAVTKKATAKKAGRIAVAVGSVKGGAAPVGKVVVTLKKGGVTRTVAAKVLAGGRVVLDLPKVAKGTWTLKVTYAGSTQHAAAAGAWRIKVKAR